MVLYTDALCGHLKIPSDARLAAVQWAIRHDMAECVTGDIMGPVKRTLIDKEDLETFETRVMLDMGAYYADKENLPPAMKHIVKAANMIDEYFHVSMEVAMGNTCMSRMRGIVHVRMTKWLDRIHCGDLLGLISIEADRMIQGIEFIQNDSDLNG